MTKRALFGLVWLSALMASGCVSNATRSNSEAIVYQLRLDQYFDQRFSGLEIPARAAVKQDGTRRAYPYTSYDRVWTNALLVMMQRCVIARASKARGVILCLDDLKDVKGPKNVRHVRYWHKQGLPMALLVEQETDGEVAVYANWLDSLFLRVDEPGAQGIGIKRSMKQKLANGFFDRLSVQVYGREKWSYLLQ